MLRRLVPLIVVLAIALAPVALEACQASCARHATITSSDGAHHHATHRDDRSAAPKSGHTCHEVAAPLQPVGSDSVNAGPHLCGHSDELPVGGTATASVLVAPPAVLPIVVPGPIPIGQRGPVAHVPSLRLSSRIALTTQLRV
jgi:hypothetical protein